MSGYLRKTGKKLPYFMLYRYPEKLNRYYSIAKKNKALPLKDRVESNAYHSPSPMNELCDYIITWEKKKIKWDNSCVNTSYLLIDNSLDLSDLSLYKKIRKELNVFVDKWKFAIAQKEEYGEVNVTDIANKCLSVLMSIIPDRVLLANYCVKVAYSNMSTNKSLVWQLFGDIMLENLRQNTPQRKKIKIVETQKYNPEAKEYLGKYYQMIEGVLD